LGNDDQDGLVAILDRDRYPQATGFPFLYVINPGGKLLAISDTREFESPYGYNATKIEEFLKKW